MCRWVEERPFQRDHPEGVRAAPRGRRRRTATGLSSGSVKAERGGAAFHVTRLRRSPRRPSSPRQAPTNARGSATSTTRSPVARRFSSPRRSRARNLRGAHCPNDDRRSASVHRAPAHEGQAHVPAIGEHTWTDGRSHATGQHASGFATRVPSRCPRHRPGRCPRRPPARSTLVPRLPARVHAAPARFPERRRESSGDDACTRGLRAGRGGTETALRTPRL